MIKLEKKGSKEDSNLPYKTQFGVLCLTLVTWGTNYEMVNGGSGSLEKVSQSALIYDIGTLQYGTRLAELNLTLTVTTLAERRHV